MKLAFHSKNATTRPGNNFVGGANSLGRKEKVSSSNRTVKNEIDGVRKIKNRINSEAKQKTAATVVSTVFIHFL